MKRLILFISIFSIYVLIICARNRADPNFYHTKKILELLEQRHRVNTLIIGDSHVAYAIKNVFLPDTVVSIAWPGESPLKQIEVLKYARKFNRINYVYIEGSDHFYSATRSGLDAMRGLPLKIVVKSNVEFKYKFGAIFHYYFPFKNPYLKQFLKDLYSDTNNVHLDFIQSKSSSNVIVNEYNNELSRYLLNYTCNEISEIPNVKILYMPKHHRIAQSNRRFFEQNCDDVTVALDIELDERYTNCLLNQDHVGYEISEEITKQLFNEIR